MSPSELCPVRGATQACQVWLARNGLQPNLVVSISGMSWDESFGPAGFMIAPVLSPVPLVELIVIDQPVIAELWGLFHDKKTSL